MEVLNNAVALEDGSVNMCRRERRVRGAEVQRDKCVHDGTCASKRALQSGEGAVGYWCAGEGKASGLCI